MAQYIDIPPCKNPKVPGPEIAYSHCIDLQTRFADIDMLGHVNNSVYLTFMDMAKALYLTEVNGREVGPGEITFAIVNINCDFYSPAYFNEPLAVATGVVRLSNRSITLEQRIFNPESGDVKCIGRTVMAGFDPVTAAGIEIPADFKQRLIALNPHLSKS